MGVTNNIFTKERTKKIKHNANNMGGYFQQYINNFQFCGDNSILDNSPKGLFFLDLFFFIPIHTYMYIGHTHYIIKDKKHTDTQVIIQKIHTHKDYINRKTLTKYGVLFLVLLF